MNYAYITLLSSEDYLPAIIVLNNSLKQTNSKYPLVVAVTENVILAVQKYLEQEQIRFKVIPYITYNDHIQLKLRSSSILNTASKISILSFYEYDKIIFIDGDTLIYRNMDELFDYPDGSMYDEFGYALSGLMVLVPSNHNLKFYYSLLQLYPMLDGDLFASLLFPFKSNDDYKIPPQYFLNITLENLDSFKFEDIYAIQFCYKYKPWKYKTVDEYFSNFVKEFPKFTYTNRVKALEDYMNQFLYPLWEKYPEFQKYCY